MRFFGSVALFVLTAWAALRWLERRLVYYPDRQMIATPAQVGMPFEDVWLRTSDGKRINGWWIPAWKNSATVLLSHGNAGNISHRLDKAARLRHLGLNVFLYDYRGYGHSAGRPSEPGTYRDAEAAYRYLTEERRIAPDRLVLYGESVGCAMAVELATHHPAAALILESPFTSIPDMADRLLPRMHQRWWGGIRYDNLAKIRRVSCPLLILHSPKDDIVPYDLGRRLYDAAVAPKQFVDLVGDHNEGYIDSGEIYTDGIAAFLKSHGILRDHRP